MPNKFSTFFAFSFSSYENKILLLFTKFFFFITCLCLLNLGFKDFQPTESSSFIFLEILFLFSIISSKNTAFFEDTKTGFLSEIRINNLLLNYLLCEYLINIFWNLILMIAAIFSFYIFFNKLNITHAILALIFTVPAIQNLLMISEAFGLEIKDNIIPIIFTTLFFFPIAIIASLSSENQIYILALVGINLIFTPLSIFVTKKLLELW